MGTDTFRNRWAGSATALYWRRRLVTLFSMLAALTLTAWLLTTALGPGPQASAGSAGPGRPGAEHHASGPGPAGGGGNQQPGGRGTRSASPPAAAAHRTSASGVRGTVQPDPRLPAGGRPATPVTDLAACQAPDVLLSVAVRGGSTQRHQWPQFRVEAVSTAARPCRFDLGAQSVTVDITAGAARIWSSADCVHVRTQVTALRQGVPASLSMYWDGRRSAAGCPAGEPLAPPGSYDVAAYAGTTSSGAHPFQLR